jgi:hypothetical protein
MLFCLEMIEMYCCKFWERSLKSRCQKCHSALISSGESSLALSNFCCLLVILGVPWLVNDFQSSSVTSWLAFPHVSLFCSYKDSAGLRYDCVVMTDCMCDKPISKKKKKNLSHLRYKTRCHLGYTI